MIMMRMMRRIVLVMRFRMKTRMMPSLMRTSPSQCPSCGTKLVRKMRRIVFMMRLRMRRQSRSNVRPAPVQTDR